VTRDALRYRSATYNLQRPQQSQRQPNSTGWGICFTDWGVARNFSARGGGPGRAPICRPKLGKDGVPDRADG
jgi:hypothetical protein